MFYIADNRKQFYQWDLNRRIVCDDESVEELHYYHTKDSCLVVERKEDETGYYFEVPNILLQTPGIIKFYAYGQDYTKIEGQYKIIQRVKPADYVYTETEIKRYELLEEQIKEIEKTIEEIPKLPTGGKTGQVLKKKSNENYDAEWTDDEKGEVVDLSNYYDKTQTNELLGKKLDSKASSANANKVYAVDGLARDSLFPLVASGTAWGIAMRGNNGSIEVPLNPVNDKSATSKAYVDGLVLGVEEELQKINELDRRVEQIERHIDNKYFTNDTTTAYKKSVPANACPYAELNSIGGMTYKSENHLNPAFFEETKTVSQYLNFINNKDGSITINGDGYLLMYDMAYVLYSDTRIYADGMYLSIDKPLPENLAILAYCYPTNEEGNYQGETFHWIEGDATSVTLSGWVESIFITRASSATSDFVVANNITIKPMLSRGSVKPYEPYYEGLRDSKVTALKVYGANLLNVKNIKNNLGTVTLIDDDSFRVDGFNVRYIIPSPKAGTYYLSYGSTRTGSYGGGVVIGTYDSKGSLIDSDAWYPDKLNGSYSQVCDGTEHELRILFYGSGSGGGSSATYTDVMLSFNAAVPYTRYHEPIIHSIPEAVQALDGYGEGFYTVYNQIRQNRITFDGVGAATYTKSCSRLILNGSENWKVSTLKANTFVLQWGITIEYGYTSEYEQFKSNDLIGTTNGIYMSKSSFAYITDKRYTTVEEFKAHLAEKPLIVLYSTTTPEVTDISVELAGFDNYIETEPAGVIEFTNEYKNAVPSSITYMLKEGSV